MRCAVFFLMALAGIGACAETLPLEDAAKIGLQTGAAAPDFSQQDQNGTPRNLASLMGSRGLVLVFFRSADWCIYCKTQIVQLQQDRESLTNAGFGLAAISYDSAAVLHEFAARKNIAYPLLSDHESTVIRAYGVSNREFRKGTQVDVNTETVYTSSIGNVPVYGISYPAVFVIGPDGKVVWRFVSESAELRLTGGAILSRSIGVRVEASRVSSPVSGRSGNVRVTAIAATTAAGLGNRLEIGVELAIPKGFHVYSPQVSKEYRGIAWRMDASQCWSIGDAVYPEPRLQKFPFAEEKLPVYEGTMRLTRELIVQPAIRADNPSIYELFCKLCLDKESHLSASGSLNLQACDEQQCFPPRSIPLKWDFRFIAPDRQRSPPDLRREFEPFD